MKGLVLAAYAAGTLILPISAYAKTIVSYTDADPASLDPQIADTITEIAASEPNFEGLVRFEDDGSILPDLSENWSFLPDRRIRIFCLKKKT